MLVGDDDLHQIERVIKRRNIAQEKQFATDGIEIVINRTAECITAQDDFGIATVAHFERDGLRSRKNLRVRKLHQTQGTCGKYVARKGRVGTRARERNVIAAGVFEMDFDARQLACVARQGEVVHLRIVVAEHRVGTFVIHARIKLGVTLRGLKACRGIAKERINAIQWV